MSQPYIESATTPSDCIVDEEIARISDFCRVAKMYFHRLASVQTSSCPSGSNTADLADDCNSAGAPPPL